MTATPAVTETFGDVDLLLWRIVHRFADRFGGDREELKAVANLAYMRAYNGYKRNGAKFSTYLYHVVWHEMLNHDERERRAVPTVPDEVLRDAESRTEAEFDMVDFARGMSRDAKAVVGMVLDSPAEVALVLDGGRRRMRSVLFDYLEGIGWSLRRIAESFREIGEALQ